MEDVLGESSRLASDEFDLLFDLYLRSATQELLLFHPTGSGKTKNTVQFAKRLVHTKQVDLVVVIVPTSKLEENMRREFIAENFDISLLHVFSMLKFQTCPFATTRNETILYILDEIHNIIPKTAMKNERKRKSDYQLTEEEKIRKRKKEYYDKLKMVFSNNYSRVILGLSATPFSNTLDIEADAYVNLLQPSWYKLKDTSAEFLAKRISFPARQLFDLYPANIVFCDHLHQKFPSRIMDYTHKDIFFPQFEIKTKNPNRTEAVLKKIMSINEVNQYMKHFIVSYHLDVQKEMYRLLVNLKKSNVLMVTSDMSSETIHTQLKLFNECEDSAYLIATYFMSEGVGLKNVNHVHIMEPFHDHTALPTIQILGRSCRLASHDLPRDRQRATVYAYLYSINAGDERDDDRFKNATKKEKIIREFLRDVKTLQTTVFTGNTVSVKLNQPNKTEQHALYTVRSATILTCIASDTANKIREIPNWINTHGSLVLQKLNSLHPGFMGNNNRILRERSRTVQQFYASMQKDKAPVQHGDSVIRHAKDIHLVQQIRSTNNNLVYVRDSFENENKEVKYFVPVKYNDPFIVKISIDKSDGLGCENNDDNTDVLSSDGTQECLSLTPFVNSYENTFCIRVQNPNDKNQKYVIEHRFPYKML
jgi:superfamily II DNA or RNA helicase